MTSNDPNYYILPSTWCDGCARQVTCQALVWEVADERIATFVCPTCGRPLGVGLRGQTSWSPHVAAQRRRTPRLDDPRQG